MGPCNKCITKLSIGISGIGDHVFPVLKFSYDSLPSVRVKDCFLYCSIFPQDYNIRKNELIKLWIGEGLLVLDEHEDIQSAGSLKLSCLLESDESEEFLRMHDVIRDILVRDTMLKTFSNEFFHYMCALKVLDLSGNRDITRLPKSSGKLFSLICQKLP